MAGMRGDTSSRMISRVLYPDSTKVVARVSANVPAGSEPASHAMRMICVLRTDHDQRPIPAARGRLGRRPPQAAVAGTRPVT